MRSKNMLITTSSASEAEALAEEYRFCGRDAKVDSRTNEVTVLALPIKYKAKSVREAKARKSKETEPESWETQYAEYS